jgi:hypothetical protein
MVLRLAKDKKVEVVKMPNELIFQIGLVVVGIAVVGGILAAVALFLSWKRLSASLDTEYGKKRR